jgi:hypothetical protein
MTESSILELLRELVSDETEVQILQLISKDYDNDKIIEELLGVEEKND